MAKPESADTSLAAWQRTQHALAQMLAHDLRNPLAAMVANLSFLDHACRDTDGEVRETLGDLHGSCALMLSLVESMVTVSALEAPEARAMPRTEVSLLEAARLAAKSAAGAAARLSSRVEVTPAADALVLADFSLMVTMATHLANNAVQHARRGSTITLSVERDRETQRAALVLRDEGPPFGPPEAHFTREAQPGLKLKSGGRYERGLGLYVVGLVAQVFDGAIATASEGGRAVVRVWFPMVDPGGDEMSNWQPARVVDVVLRFDADYGPAMKAAAEGAVRSALSPEDQCREALRALARGVGVATHAYVWAAPQIPLSHVKLPVNASDDGTHIALRLHLNVPMTQPVDYSNGNAVAGLMQALMGLPRGSLAGVELGFPEVARMGEAAPLLTTLNPETLPGQKLCEFCRNPMPDYEVECRSCGARATR